MVRFKELGIKVTSRPFVGDSIKIDRILNKEITVLHFKITDSNKKAGTLCLHLQIEYEGQKRVFFTGAMALLEAIQKVPQEKFPFTATIVKENDRYEFT
jgi:hypothetical protein